MSFTNFMNSNELTSINVGRNSTNNEGKIYSIHHLN